MGNSVDKLAMDKSLLATRFLIETQHSPTAALLIGRDAAGNVLATRTLSTNQYNNVQLKALILADLESTLRVLVKQPDLFPHLALLNTTDQ